MRGSSPGPVLRAPSPEPSVTTAESPYFAAALAAREGLGGDGHARCSPRALGGGPGAGDSIRVVRDGGAVARVFAGGSAGGQVLQCAGVGVELSVVRRVAGGHAKEVPESGGRAEHVVQAAGLQQR